MPSFGASELDDPLGERRRLSVVEHGIRAAARVLPRGQHHQLAVAQEVDPGGEHAARDGDVRMLEYPVAPAAAAAVRPRRRQRPVFQFQLSEARRAAVPWILVENDDTAASPRPAGDVRVRPFVPPSPDLLRGTRSVLHAVPAAWMFAGTGAALPGTARAPSDAHSCHQGTCHGELVAEELARRYYCTK